MPLEKLYTLNINDTLISLYVRQKGQKISTCNIFKKRETALLGISLGNSFFTKERMHLIFTGFSSYFKNVAVLLADDLAEHNFRVMGYDERKIKRKIRENSNKTRNKIKATINEIASPNITFYQWRDIESDKGYRRSIKNIIYTYDHNSAFSQEINQIVLNVLHKYLPKDYNQNDVINEAKWYFLKELAFICTSSDFFNSSVISGYYQESPLFNRNILTDLKNVSFVIYECKDESELI